MALAEDASTPAIVQQTINSGGTVTSASFSPPANSLLVVCVTWMWGSNSLPGTLTCADSLANNIPKEISQDFQRPPFWWHKPYAGKGSSSAIFTRYYTSAPGAITVTVTSSSLSPAAQYLAVRVVTGAANPQSGPGVAHSGTAGSIVMDVLNAGSWVYTVGGRPGLGAPAVGPNMTSIGTWQDSADGMTAAVARYNGFVKRRGAHWVGWIQHISELSALEIIAGSPGVPQPDMDSFEMMTADLANNWLTPDEADKPGNTSISSSTTLVADPNLTVAVLANASYMWRAMLSYHGAAGGGNIKWNWSYPAGATAGYDCKYETTIPGWVINTIDPASSVASALTNGTGTNLDVEMEGYLYTGATAGNFTLQWAQGSVNATATTLTAYSYLLLWRIG